ncbi:MAG: periplasmic heavy metal sensor [Sulfuricurvum sp.]|nr:periplasmic heavy metal sensor [Sulfuricurvum sp.]
MKSLIVILSLLCFVWADSPQMDDDHHRFPMDLDDLHLSAQQHKAAKEVMREYQSSSRLYHKQNAKIQQELNALFLNPAFDEKAYRVKSIERQTSSIEIQTQLLKKLHTILTPQQKQQFIRYIQEWDIE